MENTIFGIWLLVSKGARAIITRVHILLVGRFGLFESVKKRRNMSVHTGLAKKSLARFSERDANYLHLPPVV